MFERVVDSVIIEHLLERLSVKINVGEITDNKADHLKYHIILKKFIKSCIYIQLVNTIYLSHST